MTRHRGLVGCALVVLLGVVAGCNKKNTGGGDSPPTPGLPQGSPQATGPKALYDVHCAKCHPMAGSGKKGSGPDLTHVGAEHDAAWIADHIRDPRKHKDNSRMTKFEGTLSDEQIKALADWLAAMK